MTTWDFLLFNFKPDSTTLTFNLDSAYGLWDEHNPSGILRLIDNKVDFSAINKNTISYALHLWQSYSAYSFSETTNATGDINIYIGEGAAPGVAVANLFDGQTDTSYFTESPTGGDYSRAEIVFSEEFDSSTITIGGEFFEIILHEIGHSLGLSHPNNNGSDSNYNTTMTVMSYNVNSGHYAITPMAMDIEALKQQSGTFSYNSGNGNIYDETSLIITGADTAQTIVDTGGTDDEINLSGIAGAHTIDLRQVLDESGAWHSDYKTIVNSKEWIYIAKDTIIENATGGAGNDTITGNDADNVIKGEGGDDTIYGSAGSDELYGGTTDETNGDTVDYSAFTGYLKWTLLDAENYNYKVEKWNVGSDPTSDPADGTDMLYSIENGIPYIDYGTDEFDEEASYGGVTIAGDENNNNLGPGAGTEAVSVYGYGGDDSLTVIMARMTFSSVVPVKTLSRAGMAMTSCWAGMMTIFCKACTGMTG